MGYRPYSFAPGEIYHIFNRGVDKRLLFLDDHDRQRFQQLLVHCLPQGAIVSYSLLKRIHRQRRQELAAKARIEGTGLVNLLCYCLMPNHFHLLVRENVEGGVSDYLQRLENSYARYFNVRHQRTGSLFTGPFKAAAVAGDDYLLHVSRYIHLNPYVAGLVTDSTADPWSSVGEYVDETPEGFCHRTLLQSLMPPAEYRNFVVDQAAYAREIAEINHLTLEEEAEPVAL